MFCLRKGTKSSKDYRLRTSGSLNSLDEGLTDNNASFLRAARAGNLEKVLEFLKGNIDINTSNANGLNALHLASKEGHVNVVTELLKRGANANAATKKGNTALHIASLAGQYEVVKVLVNLGANVNVQSQNGFTPLYMAAQENHDNVVSFLLANGANQSLATEDGFTPLAVALQQGHDKVVAVLLENDTKGKVRLPALHIAAKKDDCKAATLLLQNDHNPDVTSKSGFTPLHIAAHYGNENIANILLDKGADVNYAAKHQITPLHVASKWGKSNMVTLLLDKRANIEASTRDGLTPLHCAARSGHNQVVDLLLERGAPILAKTKNGLAPLHMASQGDHVDSARILLYHKAPVDDVTVDYLTALHVAAHCGHVKVAKLLLERKADANARALNGFTPLHIACKKNRIKVVELLLKHGASIEATTESGLTPLHVASFMGCMNIVIYLIQNGANPDVPTVRGETPLHLAARANQTDIIRILLRNGANVDARAREEQTPLHIAARLGNVDIVSLLLQHGAAVDATTKDMYTALHIAAKEDQEEVASVLLDHGASLTATTKKGFTPLHLAAKYGNIKVARLLLQKDAPVDAQGKNGVTPLHVASHYDHVNVALLLLDKGASPHAMAKNGYTPLHIAAKKNQMDIATTLLEYGAKANSESKAGFTPLHLASQEGHTDITTLLIEHQADVNFKANNGLTPLHLCAQEDRVNVATVLVKNGAEIGPQTKAGYTPLHVASHFGQINMVRFLLQQNADVHMTTSHGYTPLHQAAQQGHTLVVNLLLENQASPNVTTSQGQTALSIAQRLGYISVVETLKVVTETMVTTTTTTVTEEKYKVVAPETMQETFMTDSEDEGGEDAMLGDQSYRYLTADEMKSLGDDSLPIDVTKDEKQHEAIHPVKESPAPMVEEDHISPQHITPVEVGFSEKYSPDNVDLSRAPVHAGFLVSFMVDARGGAMRGCRHSGVRVIIPPRKASMPMRITCRYLRKEKLIHPPPLMEGEACASRILEVGPVGARFLGPVIIEVPHFASLRGKEREITILRSDTGETWREHTLEASEEAVQEVLNESFEGDELSALEDLNTNRITRILTTDFPQYFAIVTRIRQEVHGVGSEGGMVSSTVVPQVQAIFPDGALTKKIRVGLQAQPIAPELVAKLLGNRVAVSPIVTVEPRRRKFHKPIKLTIPVPQAATKGMINQYSGDAPTLRLLCSITGGSSKAQWEDVTGSTPLTFVNDCVSFTTTVSARFWLMDCRQVNEASKFATELYQEAVHVPFMSKFVIFAKRTEPNEAHLRVFCMTDDKEDKTLETQENFTEIAKSRDVEVLEGKMQYLEFAGNLVPVTKSGEQLKLAFQAFHENRLAFTIRVKDPHVEPMGRIAFMKEPKVGRGEPPQVPICNLNVALPEVVVCDAMPVALELVTLEKRDDFIQESGLSKPESIHRADLRLSDIARELDKDWVALAQQLEISESDINLAKSEFPEDISEQALTMLRLWLQKAGSRATGNELEKALRKINRDDIIKKCMFNVELVTDDVEKAVAKVHLDQSGFDVFKEELGSSREASMRRGASLDISYDEQDIMKDAESAAETSSETGSIFERDQISQVFSDEKDRFIEGARIRRVSKTPPPSPAEVISKDFIEQKSPVEENVLIENEVIEKEEVVAKQEVPTPPPKPIETVDEMMKPMTEVPEVAAKQTESETWPSGEMDTSQVSVSSLPDDEKSETTTATVSSATAADAETETKVVETKEWTETDDSGAIKHVIQKTTHMTLSMQQKSDDRPDEEVPAKETISETQVSVESGDLLFVDPLLEVISAKTEDEIFRDDGYAVISDQSDFMLNFDHDTLEQNATKPKQDNVDDDQETSSYSPYLFEPEVAEYHPGYVIPTTVSLQSDVKSHSLEMDKCFNETKTQDFDSGNSLDQQTEAVIFDLEPRNGHSEYPTLETDIGFHSTVSDFENEPHDIRMTLEEIVSGSINVEPAMGPCTESVNQHRLDDPDFGEAKNFQQVKSDVDICVLEKESKLFIGLEGHPDLRDPELGKLDIPHEGTVLITELEHEYSPGDLKYSEMSKSYICEPDMSPTKLDHQHLLGDHIHDESSKVSIIELESEPLSVLSHQISFQDRKQSACFESNILETEPAAEIKNQCTYDELEDEENYKSSLVEEELQIPYTASVLETEPATEIDNNNIHDDIFVQKTCETSMSEGELEISSGTEIPRCHGSSKTSIPGLESGLHTELEHQLFVTDSVVPKSETSVPQFVNESTTNLESEGNMAKDKLEDTHSYEQNEYQEISKPNIPGEQTALSGKSEYGHSSECFESAIAGELYEAKQITESGHPYILQSSEHGAVSNDFESVVHSGFVSESEGKTHDGKPAETVESCGTSQISSGSENTGTHADYETDDTYVVPSETGATEKCEPTENELEILNSSCESYLPNVPTLIPYSDEHVRPICFSELIEPHYGAVVDQDKPANESLIHEKFEITEHNTDSAVCDISNLKPNPESNGTTVQPGIPSNLLSYSVPETEDTDQRPFGDFVHDEYQKRQETKEFDTQNAEVESSYSTIHDENLEHCDLDEIIKLPTKYDEPGVTVSQTSQNISCEPDDDDQPDSSLEGNIIKHDSPVELLITGSKDSLEEICCAPEQQQLQYMSFTSPRPLSSQEVEEMPIKSESIIHHDENLHDEHASPDLLKPESEVVSIEVTSQLPDDMPPEKEPIHVCDTHTELLESKEHPGKATVLTHVTTERLSGPDGSEMLVQSSITTVQSTTTIRTSVEDVSPEPGLLDEFHSEKFVPLAFVNTAFVGADLIDATEEMELSRARSPYEVLREEPVTKVGEGVKTLADDTGISGDVFLSDMKDYSGSEKIYDHAGQIKHVIKTEVRRRPILQHIPSEISEEDLVEREISSPVSKAEFSPEPVDKNLAEDSDKPGAETSSAFPDDKSERNLTESVVHSHPELKICEEIFPEVIESKEETFSDESGFQTVKRTVVTKTVITKTSQFSGDSADASDAMRSETSLEYKKSPIPSELVDKDLLESTEEAKVPKDSDIKAGSVCETPTEDTHMETEICELTSPESDTGVPASPFECTSEVDFSEGEHKGSEVRDVIIDSKQLSKTEEPKDSLLTSTTFTQSFSEILNVSVAKITDSAADSTLDDRKSAHDSYLSADDSFCDIESISHTSPKKSVVCDTKTDVYEYSCQESFAPQINGPVQVDYKPEYDDEEFRVEELRSVCDVSKAEVLDTGSKTKVAFTEEEMSAPEEFLGAVGGMADTDFVSAEAYKECTSSGAIQKSGDSLADAEPGKPYFYGSVSDDTVDAEIGKILSSKTETEEDIIERPRTPEPPEEVHLPEEVESSIQLRETEVFLAEHPIEKTKRTIEGVLDIDVVTNSLKFQLTSSTSHSEWDTVEGIAAHKGYSSDSASVPGQRTLGELHIESPMQLPTELACPAIGTATDADSTLSPSITQSSCVSEDSSGFVYGMQFEKESEEPEEAMDIDSDQCSDEKDTSYTYGMRFEREHELDDEDDDIPGYGDLYTHQEEDEDVIDEGEKVKMQFSSSRPLTYEKPNYSEYDTLAGRKCFGKGNELDDISMSSLQEFEKLEEEIVSGRKSSIGSVDSFNGKQIHSKSGEHDDVSMNSLTEFEKLERECAEAERAEAISQEVNARLSEIEEGHESQSSEASQETISDAAREDDSDVSDFDDRLNKIDKIMKEAQSSVDLFGDKSAVSILSQATDQKSDVFSDDSLSISATAAAKKVEEVTEMTDMGSLQKLPDSSTDASSVGQSYVQEFFHQQTDSPDVISTTVVKEIRNADGSISKVTTTVTEKRQVTKISSTIGADKDIITSSEQTFTIHKKDDIDQDSLHEDKSIKPDSLCGEEKFEYQDSLHEDKSADVDSLQEEVPDIMKDSLHEERPLDEDSLHEMDILPDESSLSLETSLAAALDPCQEPGRSDDSEFAYMLQPQTHDQDVDTDSLKDFNIGDILESAFTTHVREVALVEGGRVGDAMISSTDSLERSSSAATHATYQFETESVMSSSINSVQTSDDYTMVSSTDTVDPDIKISYGFSGASMSDIHFLTKEGQQKVFIDSEGNIQTHQDLKLFTDLEGNIQNTVMIPSDTTEKASKFPFSESDNYETCTATVTYDEGMKQIKCTSPIVRHQSEDTDESQSEYTDKSSGQFDPDVEIEEIETVDDKGNPVTVRRMKRIITTKSQTFTASSSGDDIEEKFKQFLKDHAGGTDAGKGEEEFEEERKIDEKGNVVIVRTVKQQMLTEPEIHSKSFRGLDAEELSSDFIKSFQMDPTETTEQYERVDDDGNIICVTQKVVMKPEMHTVTFSGSDAHKQMEEYMKQWTASKDDSRSQGSTLMESSPCSSKVTDASQLHYINSQPETAPCDSFGSQISSGETSQSHSIETTVDTQPGHVTTRRIVTTTTTVHHIPEDDPAFPSSPVISGETSDSHQGAHDDSYHLSSEHHSSFQVDDH